MSLQLYQVDYKSFLLDFKSVPNVSNPVNRPVTDRRQSLTNGSTVKHEQTNDNIANGGDKENVQQAINGCDSTENGEISFYVTLKIS